MHLVNTRVRIGSVAHKINEIKLNMPINWKECPQLPVLSFNQPAIKHKKNQLLCGKKLSLSNFFNLNHFKFLLAFGLTFSFHYIKRYAEVFIRLAISNQLTALKIKEIKYDFMTLNGIYLPTGGCEINTFNPNVNVSNPNPGEKSCFPTQSNIMTPIKLATVPENAPINTAYTSMVTLFKTMGNTKAITELINAEIIRSVVRFMMFRSANQPNNVLAIISVAPNIETASTINSFPSPREYT